VPQHPRPRLAVTRSRKRHKNLLTSDGPGGLVVRRLLPVAIVTLMLLGLLRWMGEREGLYGTKVGLLLMTLGASAVLGGVLWYFALGLDRNEAARLSLEAELRRNSRYFDVSRDLLCTAGLDGVFTKLNAAWTETLGWSEEELCSRPFVEFVHPDDREMTERETAGLGAGDVTVDFVNRYANKDGGWRWIDWSAIAVLDDGLIYASARDITDRKQAEAALEASGRQTRQILETAHDAFVAIDAAGIVTDWNPQAEESFGWSRDEAIGRDLAATIIPVAQREAHRRGIERFLTTGEGPVIGKRLELTALHRDGHEFPVELTISALETDSGHSFNAFLQDITERRRAGQELELVHADAVAASRAKSEFLANMSHEIRTPLNGVIGAANLLMDTPLDPEQRAYAQTAATSGDALLMLISDILDFSKIEAGKLELDSVDFALTDVVEETTGMLAGRAHDRGVELAAWVHPALPARVRGDANRVRQVLTNLVGNAVKFTHEGEVVVAVTPDPAAPDGMRFEVKDTGIGISPLARRELFSSFSQADTSTTRKYGGTGLGLAISRRLVELMGGEIGVESEVGQGSTFHFRLSLPAVAVPDRLRESMLDGLRVLVVDDNDTNRAIIGRQLSAWGMVADQAGGAREALDVLREAARAGAPYPLVVLDFNMPDMNGMELARAIAADEQLAAPRMIMLTSSGSHRESAQAAGAHGYLTKPVRQSHLHDTVVNVLHGEPPARVEPAHGEPATAAGDHALHVLLAEDNEVNQMIASRMLEKRGCRVDIAADGREAVRMVGEHDYAAVFMDCQMPGLDGYQATRVIREREAGGSRLPIVAMTAHSMKGDREKCIAAGMDDYVAKPIRTEELDDVLERRLRFPAGDDAAPTTANGNGNGNGNGPLDHDVIARLREELPADFLGRLVETFADQTPGLITDVRRAADDEDAASLHRAAHKLKGSCANLGAVELGGLCADLEARGLTGTLTGADVIVSRLSAVFEQTDTALRAELAEA